MRYLAILKDSLREARDSWVLLGLFVLSTLVIVFVAQLSFHSQSADKTMAYFFSEHGGPSIITQTINNRKPEKILTERRFDRAGIHLDKTEQLKGDKDSPLGEYALTVSFLGRPHDHEAVPVAKVRDDKGDEKHDEVKPEKKKPVVDVKAEKAKISQLFEEAEELGYIKVVEIAHVPGDDKDKDAHRYRVVVQGTTNTHRIWATEPGLLFGFLRFEFFQFMAGPLAFMMYGLSSYIIYFGSLIAVLMAIVITSFFFPNMLRKGRIDMLLVKPISRWMLLTYKYLGGLTFILLSTAYAVGGIWFALGVRSGLWANGTLLLIPSITFFFAILYAISTFVGVVTRSVIASILMAVGAWFLFFIVGKVYTGIEFIEKMEKADIERREKLKMEPRDQEERWTGGWTFFVIKTIHNVSPRTEDLNQLSDLIIYTDFMTGNIFRMHEFDNTKRNWWEAVFVSLIWIGVMLGLSCAWFHWKDY